MSYSPSTKMVLASSIYFKATWIYTFQPAKPGKFQAEAGEKEVQMMNMKRKFHWGAIGDYAQWAAIPYKSEDSLVIILPNQNQTLQDVINKMGDKQLYDILGNIDDDDSMVRTSNCFEIFLMMLTFSG
jgi:serine protease inhibitor